MFSNIFYQTTTEQLKNSFDFFKNALYILCIGVLLISCQTNSTGTSTSIPTPTSTSNIPEKKASKPSVQSPIMFPYKLRKSSLAEGQKAPLILVLHGFKSNANDLFRIKDFIDPRYTLASIQAPHAAGTDKYKWYDIIFSNKGSISSDTTEAAESVKLLSNFIDAIVAELQADSEQVYLLGFSQGAMMSLYLALSEPTKIAGIAALSGDMIEGLENHISSDKKALSNLSILVTHGKNDEVISIDNARNMERMLRKLSTNLSYKEYNMGHQISEECLRDINEWFENQFDSNQ